MAGGGSRRLLRHPGAGIVLAITGAARAPAPEELGAESQGGSMTLYRIRKIPRCERGIALPMAMITLMILSVLIIAFTMLAASEPVLAGNQLQVAQARAIAESGLERAIWALNNPADPDGIPNPLVTPAAPYDGSTAVPVVVNGAQIGTFTVSVTNGATSNERNIVATAWGIAGSGSVLKAKQKITATVYQIRFLDPPAALVVRGEISAGGNSNVDSR